MLGRNPSEPTLFQMVDMEGLIPTDHKLRKVDGRCQDSCRKRPGHVGLGGGRGM